MPDALSLWLASARATAPATAPATAAPVSSPAAARRDAEDAALAPAAEGKEGK